MGERSRNDAEVQTRTWHADAVWWNSARGALRGTDATLKAVAGMFEQTGAAYFRAKDIKTFIVGPGHVVVERVDACYCKDDSPIAGVPVMGVLTILNGLITEWRDYFDDWMRDRTIPP